MNRLILMNQQGIRPEAFDLGPIPHVMGIGPIIAQRLIAKHLARGTCRVALCLRDLWPSLNSWLTEHEPNRLMVFPSPCGEITYPLRPGDTILCPQVHPDGQLEARTCWNMYTVQRFE